MFRKNILIILLLMSFSFLLSDRLPQFHYYGTFNIDLPQGVNIETAELKHNSIPIRSLQDLYPPISCDFTFQTYQISSQLVLELDNDDTVYYGIDMTDETNYGPPNSPPPIVYYYLLELDGTVTPP